MQSSPSRHRKKERDVVATEEKLERGLWPRLDAVEVAVVGRPERRYGVVRRRADPFGDFRRLPVRPNHDSRPNLATLATGRLEHCSGDALTVANQALDSSLVLETRARLHCVVENHGVQDDASRTQRESARWGGRALEAAIADPRAVPRHAPEARGEDVVDHAESLQCAHRAEVHEVCRHRVAWKLVAIHDEDVPSVARQQQRQAAAGGAAADDQGVVFRLRVQVLGHSGADLRIALWITHTNSLLTMWPRRRS